MNGTFSIDVDPSRDLIRIRMSGFFTPARIGDFLAARRAAHARLRCGPNQHVTINDLREMKIQSQDVVGHFHSVLADPAYRSRRLAFVVASSLARMQLIRAIGSRSAQCFTDPGEAEAWLFEDLVAHRAAAAR
ncbi:MAG: hypothetical protein V4564_01650 [Pseudomonadota bacterium]